MEFYRYSEDELMNILNSASGRRLPSIYGLWFGRISDDIVSNEAARNDLNEQLKKFLEDSFPVKVNRLFLKDRDKSHIADIGYHLDLLAKCGPCVTDKASITSFKINSSQLVLLLSTFKHCSDLIDIGSNTIDIDEALDHPELLDGWKTKEISLSIINDYRSEGFSWDAFEQFIRFLAWNEDVKQNLKEIDIGVHHDESITDRYTDILKKNGLETVQVLGWKEPSAPWN